jgi:hypothetical protein
MQPSGRIQSDSVFSTDDGVPPPELMREAERTFGKRA